MLSDYTKPVVIKRNKEGVTSSDESDTADQPDGTSVRVSGDGGSNEDAGKQHLIDACANCCHHLCFVVTSLHEFWGFGGLWLCKGC